MPSPLFEALRTHRNVPIRGVLTATAPQDVLEIHIEFINDVKVKDFFFQDSSDDAKSIKWLFKQIVAHIFLGQHPFPLAFRLLFGVDDVDQKKYIDYKIEDVKEEYYRLKYTTIPDVAPEIYPGKWHTSETVPEFFRRVWGNYLGAGLKLGHLRKRDNKLYRAITNFEGIWPDDIPLPNREEELRKAVEDFKSGKIEALSPAKLVAVARKLDRDAERPKRRPAAKSRVSGRPSHS